MEPELISIPTAAKRLGIGRENLRRRIQAAGVGVPVGRGRWKVRLDDARAALVEKSRAGKRQRRAVGRLDYSDVTC